MVIIKVLKRKDAAALVVGVVLALVIAGLVSSLTNELAELLSGLKSETSNGYVGVGPGWQTSYLLPTVSALLQILALELLVRLYGAVKSASNQK